MAVQSPVSINGILPSRQYLGSTVYTGGDITTTATSAAPATATALATTVTVPPNISKVVITLSAAAFNTTAGQSVNFAIWRGTVGSGTLVKQGWLYSAGSSQDTLICMVGIDSPPAGSVTYNIGFYVTANTGTIKAAATEQALVLVEGI